MFLCSYLNGFSLKFCDIKEGDLCDSRLVYVAARLPGLCLSPARRESWVKGVALMHLFPPVPCVPITQDFRQVIQATVFTKQKMFFRGLMGILVHS